MSLAEWALRASLPAAGVCLDPFMGTGTTGIAALSLGGRFVGIDVREDFTAQFVSWCNEINRSSRRRKPSGPNSSHESKGSNGLLPFTDL
jgi:site-specific DNA-methyltransferase (adenine-specific)